MSGIKEWMGKLKPGPWQSWGSTPRPHIDKGPSVTSHHSRSGNPVPSPSTQEARDQGIDIELLGNQRRSGRETACSLQAPTSTVLHDHRELSGTALCARGLERPEVQRARGRSGRAALFPAARGRGGESSPRPRGWGERGSGETGGGGEGWRLLVAIGSR